MSLIIGKFPSPTEGGRGAYRDTAPAFQRVGLRRRVLFIANPIIANPSYANPNPANVPEPDRRLKWRGFADKFSCGGGKCSPGRANDSLPQTSYLQVQRGIGDYTSVPGVPGSDGNLSVSRAISNVISSLTLRNGNDSGGGNGGGGGGGGGGGIHRNPPIGGRPIGIGNPGNDDDNPTNCTMGRLWDGTRCSCPAGTMWNAQLGTCQNIQSQV